jgi:nitrate/nitrite transporter NarK
MEVKHRMKATVKMILVAVTTIFWVSMMNKLPYFSIDNARVIYTKKSKFVKNEHAWYTLEYFSIVNAHVIHTKGLNS